jgi:glucose/arabinose dehydrogenase
MLRQSYILLFSAVVLSTTVAQAQVPAQKLLEEDYYEIKTIAIPTDIRLEVGGLAPMPDGRLGVCTRRGEVWIIENPNQVDGTPAHFTRFASGLHEALGLAYRDGAFYCCQRGELTKLTDTDGDNQADLYESVASWGLSGNYHEYSYGPVFIKMAICTSPSMYHGWVMAKENLQNGAVGW